MKGRRFSCDEELQAATEEWLAGQDKQFYLNGIEQLRHRYEKCIEVHGDYVEK